LAARPEDVVRVRLRYPDLETFIEKYAPNVTRGGIFLASREPRPVGDVLRFEVMLRQGGPVLSGEGRVTWVQFLYVDPPARPVLESLLKKKEGARAASQPAPAATERRAEQRQPTAPEGVPINEDDVDEATMRRALDRARLLSARTDDLEALLAADPEEEPATLSRALSDLPRLLGKKPT
jgi:molecular chaperone DnaK